MRYKTKVTVVTGGKAYNPGTILPADISSADLAFLKSKKFVEPADVAPVFADEADGPEEIRKIRTKKDIFGYAASVGLDLGENYEEKALKELQEIVINFQEEKLEEETGSDAEEE